MDAVCVESIASYPNKMFLEQAERSLAYRLQCHTNMNYLTCQFTLNGLL